ncbi:hypothetical protein FHS20_004119 [Phyllobacterium endophyticum]|nr:hypothetical protein [Phyllobacterium endophyticum]
MQAGCMPDGAAARFRQLRPALPRSAMSTCHLAATAVPRNAYKAGIRYQSRFYIGLIVDQEEGAGLIVMRGQTKAS